MIEKDRKILHHLRRNARVALTDVAAEIGVPSSTVYDRVRKVEKEWIKKHTSLLDFGKLGYPARMMMALKITPSQTQSALDYLKAHPNVNSIYRINHGFDYLVELVFPSLASMHDFIADFNAKHTIITQQVYTIVDDIKREEFLP